MNALTVLFVVALLGETGIRLWLATRQIGSVNAHRDRVPELFAGQIAPAEQQRAADYTAARVRMSRWATLFEAAIKLALTLGGGLAALEALVGHANWSEPWQGTLLVLTVLFVLQLVGLPFALWRTFRIEARFGFNRISPGLFALDLVKRMVLGLALGGPLVLATLEIMERAGSRWWVWAWLVWLGVSLVLTWRRRGSSRRCSIDSRLSPMRRCAGASRRCSNAADSPLGAACS